MAMKYIFSDLDGTLLKSDTTVSKENLSAIKQLYEMGVKTVVSTGRTYTEVPPQLRSCPYIEFFICSNGAMIYTRDKGLAYSSTMSPSQTREIFHLLNEYDAFIELYTNGKPVVDRDKFGESWFKYFKIDSDFLPEMRRSRVPIGNFKQNFEYAAKGLEMFDVFFRNMSERADCIKQLDEHFPFAEHTSSLPNNLEILKKGVNKGYGIRSFCRLLNINISEVYAIGDSPNDITAFKAAGHCFAVSNAIDELKEISDGVICSNDEHVMVYLAKYFKKLLKEQQEKK